MRASAEDGTPLALIIQRLMDADLLLPDEGSALLTAVETWRQAIDREDAQKTGSINPQALVVLEALRQSEGNAVSAVRTALDRVRAIVKPCPADPATIAADGDSTRTDS